MMIIGMAISGIAYVLSLTLVSLTVTSQVAVLLGCGFALSFGAFAGLFTIDLLRTYASAAATVRPARRVQTAVRTRVAPR